MGVRTVFSQILPDDGAEVIVECRQCGTTLAPDATDCPVCGSAEIAEYRISE